MINSENTITTDERLTPTRPDIGLFERNERHFKLVPANEDQIPVEVSGSEAVLASIALRAGLNAQLEHHNDNIIETTPEQRAMEETAQNFVEATIGIRPTGKIFWQPNQTQNGNWGTYDALFNANYIAKREYSSEGFRYMHETSVLVHELVHNTGFNNRLVSVDTGPNETGGHTFNAITAPGMVVPKFSSKSEMPPDTARGFFFEEAFAEEATTKWRKQLSYRSRVSENHMWSDSKASLPLRYFDYDYTSAGPTFETHNGYSAYAAYGVSILSDLSGVNLYDLMLQMRKSNDVELKRSFISAIDSVETGLYGKLRRLQNSSEDFLAGLHLIKDLAGSRQSNN